MWSPPNKQALPSQDEMKYAREAIDELESELKVAIQVLEQAKRHVVALAQDLEERKAWIAPVRKIPFEILSEIFTVGSEISHLAPVTITEVCQTWRRIILATPRAWFRIYLNEKKHRKYLNEYLDTFLARSAPKSLHITFPEDTEDHWRVDVDIWDPDANEKKKARIERIAALNTATNTLVSALHRIECLSLPIDQLDNITSFPNLLRLTLINSPRRAVTAAYFAHSRFPRLQYLDSIKCPWMTSVHPVPIQLPPLQHLIIVVDQNLDWVKAIQSCAGTLKSLAVYGGFMYRGSERFSIDLPVLKSLIINEFPHVPDPECIVWPIQATTPVLLAYAEILWEEPAVRPHSDVKGVTLLQATHIPDMSNYPAIRMLQLNTPRNHVFDLIERLAESPNMCPYLQRVEVLSTDTTTAKAEGEVQFQTRLEEARMNLGYELLFDDAITDLSSQFLGSNCGDDMPCRNWSY